MERYYDFDLLIEPAQDGYRSKVVNSPCGQASCEFKLPFTRDEIEILLLKIGRPRRGVRRLASPEEEAVKTFGRRLFEAAFEDEVRDCFLSSLDDADHQNAGLRIRLRLGNVPELADLPWEYLYYAPKKRFFSLSSSTPIVRYLDLPERVRPLKVQSPLRVLVMVSSPVDYPPLDVEQEWSKLKEALSDLEQKGQIVLERLPRATLGSLQRRLRREACHVFHFIGHGGFDTKEQEGRLVFENEQGLGQAVGGDVLGTLLHDHRQLRLAVLNACDGARAGRLDPFSGSAQSLVQQGISAVIAMQFEITDRAAIAFAHEFYLAISEGCPIEKALAEARRGIYISNNDVEWGTPVLYLRASDGHIFEIETAGKPSVQEAAEPVRRKPPAEAEAKARKPRAEKEQRQREEAVRNDAARLKEEATRQEELRRQEAMQRAEQERPAQLEAERRAEQARREGQARQAEQQERRRQEEAERAERETARLQQEQARMAVEQERERKVAEQAERARQEERLRLQAALAERRRHEAELADKERRDAGAEQQRLREEALRQLALREEEMQQARDAGQRRNVWLAAGAGVGVLAVVAAAYL